MSTLTRITVAERFTRDWLDCCEGESVNSPKDPEGTQCVIVKEGARTLTLDLGPAALRDLVSRADYYRIETYDDDWVKTLQRSAVSILNRLEKQGLVEKVRGSHGGIDYRVKGQG